MDARKKSTGSLRRAYNDGLAEHRWLSEKPVSVDCYRAGFLACVKWIERQQKEASACTQ